MAYIKPGSGAPYIDEMDLKTYNGEPVADPGKFIRLTLRGHYVRWRIENELAGSTSSLTCGPPVRATDRRPTVTPH